MSCAWLPFAAASLLLVACGGRDLVQEVTPVEITTKSGISMIYLSGGSFEMGGKGGEEDEKPRHTVELSPFLIDKTEVTQAMFTAAQLPDPSHWKDDENKPVESLRWRDAKVYCNERSLMEGLQPCYDEKKSGLPCDFGANGYRLPTEAEWEFAARAGSSKEFGSTSENQLGQFAVFARNSNKRSHPIGSKRPNAWGIHDLYGNVSEWCHDAYDPDYYKASPAKDPTGPNVGDAEVKRIIRGGSWKATANMCRVGFRQAQQTGDTDACFTADYCGFRCVRRISAEELAALQAR